MSVSVKSKYLSNKPLLAMNLPTIALSSAVSHHKERRFHVCQVLLWNLFPFQLKKKNQQIFIETSLMPQRQSILFILFGLV